MKNILRWICVPIVAILGVFIGYYLGLLVGWFSFRSIGEGGSLIVRLIIQVAANVLGVVFGIGLARKVAPSGKELTTKIVCAFFIIINIAALVYFCVTPRPVVDLIESICSSVACVIAAISIWVNAKDEIL